jgi:hypothetical protein
MALFFWSRNTGYAASLGTSDYLVVTILGPEGFNPPTQGRTI